MIFEKTCGDLSFCADSFGAELHSIKLGGREFLWQCGEAWRRYAPVLFPFICSPEGRRYKARGEEYTMPANHGFARDSEFSLCEQTDCSVSFKLCSDDKTRAVYPYDFELTVRYSIDGGRVAAEHEVKNTGSDDMYFYLGGHPAFICDIEAGDSVVEYECAEDITQPTPQGERRVLAGERVLPLTREQFKYDVIMKDAPKSSSVTLKLADGAAVKLSCPDMGCIAVWTALDPAAQFICLEPWTSVPVYADDDFCDIEKKPHAIKLAAGESYRFSYFVKPAL